MNAVAIQAPRLPYHPAVEQRFGVDQGAWRVLTDAVFPAAKQPESIIMALAYCRARNLDIFKKPVQIVPIWDSKRGEMVDTVWPGISELRTTAMRTNSFAGFDDTQFGPMIDLDLSGMKVTVPEWAQCCVYRLIGGQRVPFVGPKVFWIETYATAKRDTKAPNSMWAKRPRGQLEKCAEAAALRRAFPEEIGNDLAAEEMEGQAFGAREVTVTAATPQRLHSGFEPEALPAPDTEAATPPGAASEPALNDGAGELSPGAPQAEGEAGAAGPAEANADEETGSAADLLAWADNLNADVDGLSLEQIEAILGNPNDQANFAELERTQPQIALDLNRAIGRRKRELA